MGSLRILLSFKILAMSPPPCPAVRISSLFLACLTYSSLSTLTVLSLFKPPLLLLHHSSIHADVS
jgi:hypothetical protein